MGLASHKGISARTGSTTLANQANAEEEEMISSEVRELLSKGTMIETTPSPVSFVSQILLAEKRIGQSNLRALMKN